MRAAIIPADDQAEVWLTYERGSIEDEVIIGSVLLITTTPEHAGRIVRAVNAPSPGSFPAVLAAVGARTDQEHKDWL